MCLCIKNVPLRRVLNEKWVLNIFGRFFSICHFFIVCFHHRVYCLHTYIIYLYDSAMTKCHENGKQNLSWLWISAASIIRYHRFEFRAINSVKCTRYVLVCSMYKLCARLSMAIEMNIERQKASQRKKRKTNRINCSAPNDQWIITTINVLRAKVFTHKILMRHLSRSRQLKNSR